MALEIPNLLLVHLLSQLHHLPIDLSVIRLKPQNLLEALVTLNSLS